MRKWMVAAAVAVVAAVPFGGAVAPVGAQTEEGASVFVIRKVVTGPATAGSAVTLTCESEEGGTSTVVLHFDATGNPTTADDTVESGFEIVDGAWVLDTIVPQYPALDRPDCSLTETDAAGATSTAWTCDFTFTAGTPEPPIGCATASGAGVGPVTATFGDTRDEIELQTWTVVFTNTYPEQAVEVEPTFTG